jgi:hypothetical protein
MLAFFKKKTFKLGQNGKNSRIVSQGLLCFLIFFFVFSPVFSLSKQQIPLSISSPCLCRWALCEYLILVGHPATHDFEQFLDLAEKQLNQWGRQGFNRYIYSSLLIDPIAVTDMSDQDLLASMEYEATNWHFHCDHELNKPEKWGISKDVRPYLKQIDDIHTVLFYLIHIAPCDTRAGSISGDGSRYWLLKTEWNKRYP